MLPRKSSCQFLAVARSLSVRSVRSSYSLENNESVNCIFDNDRVASRPANNEYDPPITMRNNNLLENIKTRKNSTWPI
jgi:hypothetical protein